MDDMDEITHELIIPGQIKIKLKLGYEKLIYKTPVLNLANHIRTGREPFLCAPQMIAGNSSLEIITPDGMTVKFENMTGKYRDKLIKKILKQNPQGGKK